MRTTRSARRRVAVAQAVAPATSGGRCRRRSSPAAGRWPAGGRSPSRPRAGRPGTRRCGRRRWRSRCVSSSPARNTHDTARSTPAISRPSAVSAGRVAGEACRSPRWPRSAGTSRSGRGRSTGRLSHWLTVSATVCSPRWWLSSWASTPASSSRGSVVERVAGDDHEVAAAGERVQVVGGQHGHARSGRGAGRLACSTERQAVSSVRPLVGRRPAGADAARASRRTWTGRMNSTKPAQQVADGEPPDRSTCQTRWTGSHHTAKAMSHTGIAASAGSTR